MVGLGEGGTAFFIFLSFGVKGVRLKLESHLYTLDTTSVEIFIVIFDTKILELLCFIS